MKNITNKQIKRCIVFAPRELENAIKHETGENVRITMISGDIWFETQYSNDHGVRYFTNVLSKYFDIKIQKLYCVGNASKFKVWIEIE